MKFRIRYNKNAGQPGRGTVDHKWRVFDENGKEYLCKNVILRKDAWTEIDPNGVDWNFCCIGEIDIVRESSTVAII
jgi:hypothetical protein